MRGMIALRIEGRRKSENLGRTELDTERTTLTALDRDGNIALGH